MSKTLLDYEREFLATQLGVSGVGKTIDDLRYEFYKGISEGSLSIASKEIVTLDMSVDKSIPNNVRTQVTGWDIEVEDVGGFHSPGSMNRIVIPSDGVYTIGAVLNVQGNATGTRRMDFWSDVVLTGAFYTEAGFTSPGATDYNHYREMTLFCPAGAVFEVHFFQNSGVALDIFGTGLSSFFAFKLRE